MSYPSIFNDVLGPVMRGPSSSHCAASLRIGRICRDLMDANLKKVLIEYDPNGSLATTHKGQGSDMGLFGGFLGWEAHDARLPDYLEGVSKAGISIEIDIVDIRAEHPNTYKITLENDLEKRELLALSTGGGMIEIIEIDGAKVYMQGDYFETLIYVHSPEKVVSYLEATISYDEINFCQGHHPFIEIKAPAFLPENILEELSAMKEVQCVKQIAPVLPILARKGLKVPFITCEELLNYNKKEGLQLWELAARYESIRGNISEEEVFQKMRDLGKDHAAFH